MESNEHTELTSKLETDSSQGSSLTAVRDMAGGWRDGAKPKKDSRTRTTLWRPREGAGRGGTGIRGINGNGKNAIKN